MQCGKGVQIARPAALIDELNSEYIAAWHCLRTENPSLAGVNLRAAMATPPNNSPPDETGLLLRFGVFELDLAIGELRKNGKRIHLQEQPLQVLVVLLENAGRIVTRDNFRQKIWPSDTFVDFDHSLNTAVNKIRESLGDSAASPRFIETLARRGYRFIAPVTCASAPPSESQRNLPEFSTAMDKTPDGLSPTAQMPAVQTVLHPDLHIPIPHRGFVRILFALIQVMFLAFYLSALAHLHEIDRITSSFLNDRMASLLVGAVLVTGAIGIPLRLYLIASVAFDFRGLGTNFRRMFPCVLALDQFWGIAPFLLVPRIGLGLAFAATAALLYVPFSERTLIRMAYHGS